MMSYCEFSVVPFGLFTAKWHVTKISKKSILKKDIIEVYNIKKDEECECSVWLFKYRLVHFHYEADSRKAEEDAVQYVVKLYNFLS